MTIAERIRKAILRRSMEFFQVSLTAASRPSGRGNLGRGSPFPLQRLNGLEMSMRKTLSLIAAAGLLVTLAACGHNVEQRAATGAVAGAVVGGPVGAAAGAAVGTAVSKTADK